jgi:hypothetical protein
MQPPSAPLAHGIIAVGRKLKEPDEPKRRAKQLDWASRDIGHLRNCCARPSLARATKVTSLIISTVCVMRSTTCGVRTVLKRRPANCSEAWTRARSLAGVAHSTLKFASLTTLLHFAASALMNSANWSGEPAIGSSMARSRNFSRKSGSANTF